MHFALVRQTLSPAALPNHPRFAKEVESFKGEISENCYIQLNMKVVKKPLSDTTHTPKS